MKVGQTIRRPALFEIKEQYGGFFDLLDKHIKDDEQLTKIFEQIFISLEWHCKPPQKLYHLKRNNSDKINQEHLCEKVSLVRSRLLKF